MSRIIDELPEKKTNGKRAAYPLEEWFDGQARILTKGEDFDCKLSSLRSYLSGYSKRAGLRLETRAIDADSFAIQARPRDELSSAAKADMMRRSRGPAGG